MEMNEQEPMKETVETEETAQECEKVPEEPQAEIAEETLTEVTEEAEETAAEEIPAEPEVHAQPEIPTSAESAVQPEKKKKRGYGKTILAAVLVIALVAAGCFGTAAVVNNRWEKQMAETVSAFQNQVAELRVRMDDLQSETAIGTGISVSGTASADGLTPAQVYARNVRSVVAIAANSQSTNAFGQMSETASSGSGFILTEDGYVVTNYHVVEDAYKLTVITYDGTEYDAQLCGANKANDVAVLKIEGENMPAVTIGNSSSLIVGDMVVAIGNPLGELTSTQTVGYVSAKDRTINVDGTIIDMLQTDAAINAGNSGGPLFNMHGEVVGITSAKYSGNSGSGASIEGIGFAIPIDDVIGMIADIREYGYITGAYLNVKVLTSASDTGGVLVQNVVEGGCAQKAGVRAEDVIVGLGPYKITGYTSLYKALLKFHGGDTSTIRVLRDGQVLELTITFDERPPEQITMATQQPEVAMPSEGNYDEWYEYFFHQFGQDGNDEG